MANHFAAKSGRHYHSAGAAPLQNRDWQCDTFLLDGHTARFLSTERKWGVWVCLFSVEWSKQKGEGFAAGGIGCYVRAAMPWKKKEQEGTVSEEIPSKETEEQPVSSDPVENPAPPSAETDSREDRLQNLKNLYEAGVLSREEYNERKKKL